MSNFFIYAVDGKDFTAVLRMVNIETGEIISDISDKFITMNDDTDEEPTKVSLEKNSNYPNAKGGTSVIYRLKRDAALFCLKKGYEKYRPAIFVKGAKGQEIRAVYTVKETTEPHFFLPPALQNKGFDLGSGKPRPTLIGPGQNICSAYNLYERYYFTTQGEVDDVDYETSNKKAIEDLAPDDKQIRNKFNRNHYYGYMYGTSMSTPHVAGILALWMQADNKLTVNKIKSVMSETCVKDSYVTNLTKIPSKSFCQAGYGKIDAMAGLKMILNKTAIDVVVNDGQRQATPATMYDVDAPVYNVIGQQVAKDTPGIVIYKGKKYFNMSPF